MTRVQDASPLASRVLAVVVRLIRRVVAVLVWCVRGGARLAWSAPVPALLLTAAGWVAVASGRPAFVVAVFGPIVAQMVWCRCWTASFQRFCAGPVVGWRRRRWIRRHWVRLATSCGLSIVPPPAKSRGRRGELLPRPDPVVPRLRSVTSVGPRLRVRLVLRSGQTLDDVYAASERLRTALNAARVRVDPAGAVNAAVTFTMTDLLAGAFDARVPAVEVAGGLDRVWMGRAEDGGDWWLPLGPHTLVVGCSGSGKGSVFWSFAFGLAPAVHAGLVRLYGVDLKGGMEVLVGADLFSMRATNAAEAVVVLEHLVESMTARTTALAGTARSHTATVEAPLHVVMIDELAALTAYCPDRDLRQRAELAINLLCSQGRAPGFVMFACLQDPRKEVIPSRGLFTQMVGLRLKDATETSMVLGDAALLSGAHCHRIARTAPGTGYVVPEDGGYPIRVRAGYASDTAIRQVAQAMATPFTQAVVVPEPDPDAGRMPRPRASRPRARQGEGGEAA
ncbi:MAG TPA: FtsK/SpoIIIE domain-containing protein [Jatrophihabitantaceae bacterium]|jgi:S-DNA-T family DNA segregation ATPase FtsK/SpoIIIE|nr:FtsK/SpoIIIE domain-containing protein [Jatrophihabitantaceae bacterium]